MNFGLFMQFSKGGIAPFNGVRSRFEKEIKIFFLVWLSSFRFFRILRWVTSSIIIMHVFCSLNLLAKLLNQRET